MEVSLLWFSLGVCRSQLVLADLPELLLDLFFVEYPCPAASSPDLYGPFSVFALAMNS
jgi:hypothetical protein